ncbi:glutathione S-transferase [Jiella avicenniae]|uniref:glutathione transferase n=1 Tax=Jiella avicenniae TaxID=2907202 RepID=A0A9X1NXX4_9HYPH|nr:glutathione S-transferase [Jiella avicenniae]MCE7027637.1 glutathione S-transferase [Jiella avicenniae]MCE7028679.1 glutathione S-transferase [Jiella avicenniae]
MRLFDGGRAPNPRRTRIFLAEKQVEIALVPVDMARLEHRSDEIASRNPFKRLPVLELDDGTVITESIAICRYVEALHPEPPLFGTTPIEIAMIEMWNRRLELGLYASVAAAFRHIHPAMAEWEVPQVPAWGEANRDKAAEFLHLFDGHLAANRFAAGDGFSVADITGLVAVDFMKPAKIAMPEGLSNVARWYDEVSARPSAGA